MEAALTEVSVTWMSLLQSLSREPHPPPTTHTLAPRPLPLPLPVSVPLPLPPSAWQRSDPVRCCIR